MGDMVDGVGPGEARRLVHPLLGHVKHKAAAGALQRVGEPQLADDADAIGRHARVERNHEPVFERLRRLLGAVRALGAHARLLRLGPINPVGRTRLEETLHLGLRLALAAQGNQLSRARALVVAVGREDVLLDREEEFT